MNSISKLWYHLTAYIPRRLPRTPAEYERMKRILIHAFGLPDEAPVWALVSGQISSQHPHKIRMAWGNIANAAHRIQVNNVAQEQRKLALGELQAKLAAATQKHSKLVEGIDKLLGDHPDLMKEALDGDEDALEMLAEQAAEAFPEQGATPEQWSVFIKNQAIQKNVAAAKKETENDPKSEELKVADAEPGARPGESAAQRETLPLPAEALGKRGGKAGRATKGTA